MVTNQLIEHRASHAACIDIALPVVAGDDAALTELIATGEQLLHRLIRLVDVGQQQCRSPEEHSMPRGIGPLIAVLLLLLGNQRALVVVGVGTLAVELGLCAGMDAVARGADVLQDAVYLWRALLRDFQPEERPHLVDDGLHAVHGIALSLGSTRLVLTHQLAPEVL